MAYQNRIVEHRVMNPAELKENPKNWRKHPSQQAAGLNGVLSEIGWVQSVILNRTTGNLVDGHLRVELALREKETEIPVVVVDLTEAEEDEILASFDPISAMAKCNHEALAALIAGITSTNPEVKDLIDRIKKQSCIPYKMEGDEEVQAKDGSGIAPGDLFLLGEHRIMCGSSADPEHVKTLFSDRVASLMITDPPYGVDYGSVEEMRHDCSDTHMTVRPGILGDKNVEDAKVVWDYAFTNIIKYMKDGAPFYCFAPQGNNYYVLADSLNASGFEVHQNLIWMKNRFVLGRSDYKYKHEALIYGWKKGAHPWFGGGNEISVWECDAPSKSPLHPTQKPVALYERAIINSSEVGEWVIEPFGGSGTGIIACENKGRKCLCMELDPDFCASIIGRWEETTGKKAVKENL